MAPLPRISDAQISKYRVNLPKVLRDAQSKNESQETDAEADTLPEPAFFDSLDEFYSYSDCRNSDPERVKLIKTKSESDPEHKQSTFDRNRTKPQLMICHDFQGGYNESDNSRGYTFEHWHLADIFIYFSHKRVSPPPSDWIRASKRHGTKILGTLIFEWKESIPDLAFLLRGPNHSSLPYNKSEPDFSPFFANSLIDLAISREFSGYLINIEVSLSLGFSCSGEEWPPWIGEKVRRIEMKRNVKRLKEWLKLLREKGKEKFKELGKDENEWEIIWYDSISFQNGELEWQDALTFKNKDWLEVTDGIFTNYTWSKPAQNDLPPGNFPIKEFGFTGPKDGGFHPALKLSSKVVDEIKRKREDVFVGIDVFGRSCLGGFDTWKSLEMIGPHRKGERWSSINEKADEESGELGLSVALFAPGWTWEHEEPKLEGRNWLEWFKEDLEFFQGSCDSTSSSGSSSSHLPISNYFRSHPPPILDSSNSNDSEITSSFFSRLLYLTNFTLGSGSKWFFEGNCIKDWDKEEIQTNENEKKLKGWTDHSVTQPKADLIFKNNLQVFKVEYSEDDAWFGGVSMKISFPPSSSIGEVDVIPHSKLLLSTVLIPNLTKNNKLIATIIIKRIEEGKRFVPSEFSPFISEVGGESIKFLSKEIEFSRLTNGWVEIQSRLELQEETSKHISELRNDEPKCVEVGEFGIGFQKMNQEMMKGMEFLLGEIRLEIRE